MCLIVDVNVAPKILLCDDDPDFCLVYKCLFLGKPYPSRLVYGGTKFLKELAKISKLSSIIASLDRSGRAKIINSGLVDGEMEKVIASGLCKSDDEHIIALARISKASVLCSNDANLQKDFGNPDLVKNPRGKIYKNSSHIELLRDSCT